MELCEKCILKQLYKIRKEALKRHTYNHYVDYRVETWNDPVDGLDYAIGLLEGRIKE